MVARRTLLKSRWEGVQTNMENENDDAGAVVIPSTAPERNPARVYLAGLNTQSGRRTMRQALGVMAGLLGGDCESLPWGAVRIEHTAVLRAQLATRYKAATVNKFMAALRGTLKAAWQLGMMSAEDYHLAASVRSVRGETLPRGRSASAGEIAALLDACQADQSPAGARDAAVLALLYATGARRAEIAGLNLADYDAEAGRLILRGKGNKERASFVAGGAAAALADWLRERGPVPGPLFCPVLQGGRILDGQGLTPAAVYNVLTKRCAEAGVRPLSPHDLRRTFVSDLLDAGADIATVQKMAGHANVQTTSKYDRRPDEARRKAAGLLHVPYRKRG